MCCQRRVMCACLPVANCFRNGVFKRMVFCTNLPHTVRTQTKGQQKQQPKNNNETNKHNEHTKGTKAKTKDKRRKAKNNKLGPLPACSGYRGKCTPGLTPHCSVKPIEKQKQTRNTTRKRTKNKWSKEIVAMIHFTRLGQPSNHAFSRCLAL